MAIASKHDKGSNVSGAIINNGVALSVQKDPKNSQLGNQGANCVGFISLY